MPRKSKKNIEIKEPDIVSDIKPTKVKFREPLLSIAAGKKGCGKTYTTVHNVIIPYVEGNPKNNVKPRRVLIFDVNNEYGQFGFKAISLKDLALFTYKGKIEARRILPINDDGSQMGIYELQETLNRILNTFKGGLLVIEDPARYTSSNMNMELIGKLCTQRHVDCDIYMHYQSIGRVATPSIVSNVNVLRFHMCTDKVERHKGKFEEKVTILKLAENIIEGKYSEHMKNNREGQTFFPYYLYIDFDRSKITGDFTQEEFRKAIELFIQEGESEEMNKLLKLKDRNTGKQLYNYKMAFDKAESDIYEKYYGN